MAGTLVGTTVGIKYLPAAWILIVLAVELNISGLKLLVW
jgi:hypothetical protein